MENASKHTPGPWVAAKNDATVICAGDDPVQPGKILFVLRHPWGTSDHLPQDEMEANGKLAAAAPHMLAALKEIRELLMAPDRDPLFAIEDALVPLDFAVSKASAP